MEDRGGGRWELGEESVVGGQRGWRTEWLEVAVVGGREETVVGGHRGWRTPWLKEDRGWRGQWLEDTVVGGIRALMNTGVRGPVVWGSAWLVYGVC